jgi:hypothetical protein
MIQVPVGKSIEQQRHSKREPAVLNTEKTKCPKPREGGNRLAFLVGQKIQIPDIEF